MFEVSPGAQKALDSSVSYSIFSRAILEAELNGYVDYSINFPDSLDPNLFPDSEVLKVRRPDGGLPKLIAAEGRVSDITIDSECYSKDRSWYRVPSKDSKYKYFRTEEVSGDLDIGGDFYFDQPLEFQVEYSEEIRPNYIVVGFEYSNSLPRAATVELLRGSSWQSLGDFDVPQSGLLEIFYSGVWSQSYNDGYEADSCRGIRLTISRMDRPNAAIELIQISPRLRVDIADRISKVNISKTSQETTLANPVGTSSSNSCNIEISNNDGVFDFYNQDSIFKGIADVNVKFTLSDIVEGEEVPQGDFFANSWNYTSTGSLSVDASDYSKFLQAQSMENSFYVDRDLRFVIADILERAGVVKYELCFAPSDLNLNSPFYFFNDEETVWDALQQLALAEQAFYYFDNLGRFVWNSRDYWWQSSEVDYVLRARREGEKLANLVDYNHQFTIVANKATINYTPTNFLNNSSEILNNYYRELNLLPVYIRGKAEFSNALWELSEDTFLVSSRLRNDISDDSEYFLVDPAAYRLLPETGIVMLDAEYIRYSKVPRLVSPISKGKIENVIRERLDQVSFAVAEASERKSVPIEDVQIVLVQDVLWEDSSLGCPEPDTEYDDTPVNGFFLILRAGDFFLQYNGSDNGRPFLCAIADVTEEKENISYWKIISEDIEFFEGSGGIQIDNALFIEERGAFSSAKKDHSIDPVPGGESFTFLQAPPVVLDPPNRLFASTYFEDSKLKLRANRYDLNMVHHYSPNSEGDFDIYGAQLLFPATEIKDRAGKTIDFRYLSQGIAGIFINQTEPGTGYYIELITSQYTNLSAGFIQNVRVWKYDQVDVPIYQEDGEDFVEIGTETITIRRVIAGYIPENLFTLSLEELEQVAGARVSILPESNQDVNVYFEKIQRLIPIVTLVEPDGENPFGDLQQEVEFVLSDAAQKFDVSEDDIEVVEFSRVDWPDASLGWPQTGYLYPQVVVPGYFILIEVDTEEGAVELEYRGRNGQNPITEEDAKKDVARSDVDRRQDLEKIETVALEDLIRELDRLRSESETSDGEDFDGEDFDGEDFRESVFTISDGVRITVTVNGRRIFAVEDIERDDIFEGEDFIRGNTIYTSGNWGVFSRGSTDVDFEFVYAIDRKGNRSALSESQIAIRDQINGGFVDNTLEHHLSEFNELRNIYFFDDFGSWAREVKEFDVENEVWPAFYSRLFISQEDKIFKVYQKLDQFSSKFAIGSRMRGRAERGEIVVLSGDDARQGFSMSTIISGPPINRSETEILTKTNDKSIWRRGEEEVFVDSPWIQTKKQAERVANWIIQRWSSPSEVVEAQVMVDPRIEVGDLVVMSVPENNITPETHLFHVTSIDKTVGDSHSMSLGLRRANF